MVGFDFFFSKKQLLRDFFTVTTRSDVANADDQHDSENEE